MCICALLLCPLSTLSQGGPHFIPGLDSHLYVLENDHLQQLPFTADMLMNEDFVIKGSFLVGSKERAVYGLNALSGEVRMTVYAYGSMGIYIRSM